MILSEIVFDIVSDSDVCNKLGDIEYSTNPRELVTIQDMINNYYLEVSKGA
jgi:hypothetical protein